MRQRVFLSLTCLFLGLLMLSCQKAPFLTLSTPKTISFTDQGGTKSIAFSANRSWSISSPDSWCKVTPSSGDKMEGDITVTVVCEPNMTYDSRNTTLTIKVEELSETINVTQDSNLGLFVSPSLVELTNASQTIEIEVRTNVNFSVEIDATCRDWISQIDTKGLSTDKISFLISANETFDNRSGKITVKQTDGTLSETVIVKQSQTDGLIITTSDYHLSKDSQNLEVEVKANVSYEESSDVDWIHYITTKALSTSSIVLSIDANETYYSRQGAVVVRGTEGTVQGIIKISQDQTNALFITDEIKDYIIPSIGGIVKVNVFHNIDFEIDPSSLPDWLTCTSDRIDSYNTQLSFDVKRNNWYIGRSVSLSINGEELGDAFTINQHQVDTVYIDKLELDYPWSGGPRSIRVYSDVDYDINQPSWTIMELESTTQDGYLKVETYSIIPEENLDVEREGDISLLWNNEGKESVSSISIKQDKWHITLDAAGKLINIITYDRLRKMKALTVSGEINGTDVLYIRRMEELRYLNLQGTRIVEGGVSYANIANQSWYTSNDNIGFYMFQASDSFRSLREVILPSTIKELGASSFRGHWYLEKVIIPESVTVIASSVFTECFSLDKVELPSHLERIEAAAFYQCGIREITIPATVREIGQHAFFCEDIIVHIKSLPSTLTNIGFLPFGDSNNPTIFVPKGYKDEYMLTSIGDYAKVYEE